MRPRDREEEGEREIEGRTRMEKGSEGDGEEKEEGNRTKIFSLFFRSSNDDRSSSKEEKVHLQSSFLLPFISLFLRTFQTIRDRLLEKRVSHDDGYDQEKRNGFFF